MIPTASGLPAAGLAATRLRERIAGGLMPPGHQLREVALANELEVSRNTLREAFTALAAEGLVERVPNRGVFVATPGVEEVRHIFSARRLVEPAAVAWGTFDATQLELLRTHVERAELARRWGDLDGMAAENQAFQAVILNAGGSVLVEEFMQRVQAMMRLLFHSMAAVPSFHSMYIDGHRRVLALLDSGLAPSAAEALGNALTAAETELVAQLAR